MAFVGSLIYMVILHHRLRLAGLDRERVIVEAHPALIGQAITLIYQGHSAAWSWQQAINERVGQMQKLDDPVLAGRAVDLSDVGQRVLRLLVESAEPREVPWAIGWAGPDLALYGDLTAAENLDFFAEAAGTPHGAGPDSSAHLIVNLFECLL